MPAPRSAASSARAVVAPTPNAPGSLRPFYDSFRRTLLAENKAPRTVQTYMEALGLFAMFLIDQGMPTGLHNIHREHTEGFIADLLAKGQKPATAANRYRSLQAFFKWCVDEDEIKQSPMHNMKPPKVPEEPPEVLTEDQFRRLLKTCDSKTYEDKRGNAIIRLLIDTGMRRAEIAGLKVDDVNLEINVAIVMGKGGATKNKDGGKVMSWKSRYAHTAGKRLD